MRGPKETEAWTFGGDSAESTGHPGDQHGRAEGEGGQPKRIDNCGALTIHIETWEGNYRIHQDRTSEELTVAMLCMCLNCTLAPLTIYKQMRAEVLGLAEAGSSREQESAPMDVDGLAATERVQWKTFFKECSREHGTQKNKREASASYQDRDLGNGRGKEGKGSRQRQRCERKRTLFGRDGAIPRRGNSSDAVRNSDESSVPFKRSYYLFFGKVE